MDDTLGVVTAVLLGLLVVVVGILAFRVSERVQLTQPGSAVDAPAEVEDDLLRLLTVLHTASVVLGPGDDIVRAMPSTYALGVARGGVLVHQQLLDLVAEARRDGGSREATLTLPRGPGAGAARVILQVQVVALSQDRVLLLAEDRTAAQRLDEVRRDFVANISHELKTPVGAIALLAETVADSADDSDAVRLFAARLGIEAHRLAGLVQDIIDLSRLQDVDVFLDSRQVEVAAVVDEAVERSSVEARARDIAVTAQAPEGLAVFGDHALLVTAVRNLLDNALRYSDGGTRVTVVAREGGEEMVEIAVIDQGIGIDQTLLPRVFERFYRVDPARSRVTGGTGLGLSIVKHIAADHGGEVAVWSQVGRGSTFTLRLPVAQEHAPGAAQAITPADPDLTSRAAPAAAEGES